MGFAAKSAPKCAGGRRHARPTPHPAFRRAGWPPAPAASRSRAAAHADDLIQLSGDPPVTIAGNVSYGLLYLDGTVRFSGDTAITATDVFIGPDAQLLTCFDRRRRQQLRERPLDLDHRQPAASRSRPAIDLRGGVGHQSHRRLARRQGRARLARRPGRHDRHPRALRLDHDRLARPRRDAGAAAPPAPASSCTATRGVLIGGDVSSAGTDTATGAEGGRETSGGGVDLASSGGDVNVLGAIASWGRDVAAASGPVAGRPWRPRDRRRVARFASRAASTRAPGAASTPPPARPARSPWRRERA